MSNYWESTPQQTTQQQTAWLARRSKGLGGSEIGIILGQSPYRTPYSLWLEKTGKKQPDNISALPHVQRGIRGEIAARMLLERKYMTSFQPKEWTRGDVCRCTDDGYSLDKNWILEIKCMGKDAHDAASQGNIPEHYRLQCVWNLMVSGAALCLFVSFRPEDESMHIIEVTPDPAEGDKLRRQAEVWWQTHVVAGIAPPLSSSDYVECRLESWQKLADEYKLALNELKTLEERVDKIKTALSEHLSESVPALKGAGITVSRTTRQGSIDYKRVPFDGDLEQYRKPSTTYTIVRIESDEKDA